MSVAPDGTQLTTLLPSGSGIVDVTVTVAGITTPAVASEQFAYLTLTAIIPPQTGVSGMIQSEPLRPGVAPQVQGYGFIAGQTTVTLTPGPSTQGGQTWTIAPQNVTVNSTGTALTFATPFEPALAIGLYLVTVTTPYGALVSPIPVYVDNAGPNLG